MTISTRWFSLLSLPLLSVLLVGAAACGGDGAGRPDAGDGGAPDTGLLADHPEDAPPDVAAPDGGDDADDMDAGTDPDATVCPPGADAAPMPPPPGPDSVVLLPGTTVTTVAGGATAGTMDGPMAIATLSNPVSVAIEPSGTLLVCDWDSNRIRRIAADGTVTTLVLQANFRQPFGMVFAPGGILYVGTDVNSVNQKNRLSGTVWRVDTTTGAATVVSENVGRPRGLAAMSDGRLVLADYQNERLRLLDPAATPAAVTDLAGVPGCPGLADGQGEAARLGTPYGITALPDGRFVVADEANHVLRVVTAAGEVSIFAGDGGMGTVDGPRLQARFVSPRAVAADSDGNVYVSDADAHRIRKVGSDGVVVTIAGDGVAGFKDGSGAEAQFQGQEGITSSADGKTIYVADGTAGEDVPHHRVRKITLP